MMQRFIPPQVITVNGKPAPCLCRDEKGVEITCEYCTQANLVLWEREQQKRPDPEKPDYLRRIMKRGIRTSAKDLGISHTAIQRWIKTGKMPDEFAAKVANWEWPIKRAHKRPKNRRLPEKP